MMKRYSVPKIDNSIRNRYFQVKVPGSKSITNRAMLLAMLSDGECCLKGALFSDDSRYLQKCIGDLGFEISCDETAETVKVKGLGGRIPSSEAEIYVGSAGTAARFLTALLGLKNGIWHLDSSEQMRRRPMLPLIRSLEELGTEVVYGGEEGHFPFIMKVKEDSDQQREKKIIVNIDHSSQFLSALLIAAGSEKNNMDIVVEGKHGMSYIDMTLRMMEQFGVVTEMNTEGALPTYRICPESQYRHQIYEIEPDVSAACYFYALAAVLGIEGMVEGVHFQSLQGDVEFLRILERMGCTVWETEEGVRIKGPENGHLNGITVDMHTCSDQAITLAAIAPYADGPVKITGIGHIRFQESDRISAVVTELRRMGITCEEGQDEITIWPGMPKAAEIHTYDDHRMAMGFSLTGLCANGIEILDPGCCRKTFEQYFSVLDHVIEEITD